MSCQARSSCGMGLGRVLVPSCTTWAAQHVQPDLHNPIISRPGPPARGERGSLSHPRDPSRLPPHSTPVQRPSSPAPSHRSAARASLKTRLASVAIGMGSASAAPRPAETKRHFLANAVNHLKPTTQFWATPVAQSEARRSSFEEKQARCVVPSDPTWRAVVHGWSRCEGSGRVVHHGAKRIPGSPTTTEDARALFDRRGPRRGRHGDRLPGRRSGDGRAGGGQDGHAREAPLARCAAGRGARASTDRASRCRSNPGRGPERRVALVCDGTHRGANARGSESALLDARNSGGRQRRADDSDGSCPRKHRRDLPKWSVAPPARDPGQAQCRVRTSARHHSAFPPPLCTTRPHSSAGRRPPRF